ncbi:MAG: hypothetical protein AAFX06_16150 [Planctomycetota bacterium]
MQRTLNLLLALIALPLIVGCDGCRPAPKPENEEDKNAPKTAYSTEPAIAFPNDVNATFGALKPGHWMTVAQSIRSNQADMRGELRSHSSMKIQNADLETTGIFESRDTIRPVVLPKGQMRQFEFRTRVPVPRSVDTKRLGLSSRLVPRSGGIFETGTQPFVTLQGAEYFFVVLTTKPDRFTLIQKADWARSKERDLDMANLINHNYRVVVPDANSNNLIPLPDTMLDWSSIGVVLWDDLSEDALTPPQQTALADWVRFGGRLIVNGPTASEALANTAIADLLPLYPTGQIEMDQDAAVALLENWSVKDDQSIEKQVEMVRSESSRIAIDGRLEPDATAVENTGSLVVTRRVGRGNIVQPRFDIVAPWIEAWDSYDSFVSGVLLERPARTYESGFEQVQSLEDLSLFFAGTNRRSDAAANTQFRLLARDSILPPSSQEQAMLNSGSPFDAFHRIDAMTGLAAWDDNSDTMKELRETLTNEAGIAIPGSSLVLKSLGLYLLVLVPINFIVFKIMNRLEYAWFAVPLIAILGAIYAARQAQLDIGFARSNTEIGVLEAHAGYPRAHLTRVVGVYNSLASRYTLQFATVDGIAAPLDDEPDPGTEIKPVLKTGFEQGPSLDNFAVPSNRMRYIHTEEMIDLGGGVTFDEASQQLMNDSNMDLLDAIVVNRLPDGSASYAVVGGLAVGETKTIDLNQDELPTRSEELPMGTGPLMRRMADARGVPPGSARLIARVENSVSSVEFSPSASQQAAQTIVVVHLKHAPMAERTKDTNLPSQFRAVNRLDDKPDSDSDEE